MKGIIRMEFDHSDVNEQYQPENAHPQSAPQPQQNYMPPIPPSPPVYYAPAKKRTFGGMVLRTLFVLSLLCNLFLFMVIIAMATMVGGTGETVYEKYTLIDGTGIDSVAVINIQGVIQQELSEDIRKKFKAATEDENVKAVIVRIVSPGGTVSASDQIHHEISKYKQATGNPVVAFMQTVAASGGYYSAVACDHIIAEPTVITGSIGVIMNNFVLKDLLNEKLGITPVTVKSGEKKDWPSAFNETTDEQIQYLQDKLIGPAYQRFVSLVINGRGGVLTEEQVLKLADGSIFSAFEALDEKLIDEIGYIENAIMAAEKLAGITGAQVFEYREPFSLASLVSAKTNVTLPFDTDSLTQMLAPQLLYMWQVQPY